jgi:hypothetical protein
VEWLADVADPVPRYFDASSRACSVALETPERGRVFVEGLAWILDSNSQTRWAPLEWEVIVSTGTDIEND